MHDPPHVEVLVNLACVCGGIAAGVSWTAQGPYFSHASRTHAALTGASVVATTARFAAIFGFIELLIESCVCRVGSAVSLIGALHPGCVLTRACPRSTRSLLCTCVCVHSSHCVWRPYGVVCVCARLLHRAPHHVC